MRNENGSRPRQCTICGKSLNQYQASISFPFCSDACYWVQIRKVGKRMLERRGMRKASNSKGGA